MTRPTIPPEAGAAGLKRFGITRVATEHFLVGPYRYSKLADTFAKAQRHPPAGNDR